MNILIVSRHEPIPHLGGIERISLMLTRQFRKDGHIVKNLALVKTEQSVPDDIVIDYFPSDNPGDANNAKFLSDYIREKHIEVLINQYGLSGNESALFLSDSTPIRISELHSDPKLLLNYYYQYLKMQGGGKLLLIPFIPLLKIRYRRARNQHFKMLNLCNDAIVLLSEKYKTFKTLQTSKVVAIPNAVDSIIDENYSPADKQKQILYVGRLERFEKAPQELIMAFSLVEKKHTDWKLTIVGEGPDRSYMEKVAADLKIKNIEFTGFVDPNQYYKTGAIHCLTSNNEGFGMALIEGMAYKSVPVAYNSFPVASEIIDDNINGLLAKHHNRKDLANKICYLIQNPQERYKMAEAAYNKVRNNYSIEAIANRWYSIINNVSSTKIK